MTMQMFEGMVIIGAYPYGAVCYLIYEHIQLCKKLKADKLKSENKPSSEIKLKYINSNTCIGK